MDHDIRGPYPWTTCVFVSIIEFIMMEEEMRMTRKPLLVLFVAGMGFMAACDDDYNDNGCFKGNYTIAYESDVAELEPYTCINGSLHVKDVDLTSLELPNLETIGGDLVLGPSSGYQFALTNLNLSSLVSVEGDVHVMSTQAMEDLVGLNSLTSVGGELHIHSNEALTTVNGLNDLVSVGGNLVIDTNNALINLGGLNDLVSVGGAISIIQNPNLPQCEACDLVEQVGGDPEGINGNQQDTCSDFYCS